MGDLECQRMIQLSDLLGLLQGVKHQGGDKYLAKCPCHDDNRASLSVSMGEDRILLHCFAGCAYEDILKKIGVDWRDLVSPEKLQELDAQRKGGTRRQSKPRQPKPTASMREEGGRAVPMAQPAKEKRPADLSALKVGGEYVHKATLPDGSVGLVHEPITDCYVYEDADGRPFLRVFRTKEKSFPVIHEDGGQWYWGDGGHAHVLYRLPEVLKAIANDKMVYLVEGEKDVETICAWGLVGTTNKGGAGKWDEILSERLRGARVAIVPDIDEPGRKHAHKVARALAGVAKEVRIVNLARQTETELPPKGDISDLYEALGHGKAKLVFDALVEHSPVLSRVVSDEDYEAYFDGIPGCQVRSACISSVSGDGTTRQLSNFVALPVEQVVVDDGGGRQKYMLTIRGWSATGLPLRTLTIPLSEFESMRWALNEWGIYANISEVTGAMSKLRRIIQEAGMRAVVHKTLYTHTGWRRIDGKLCYLHGTGAIGADNIAVQLDFGLERYSLDGLRSGELMIMDRDAARVLCQSATLRVLRVAGLRVGVPVVGFMFLTPLRYFLEQRGHRPSFVPYLAGTTGYGKSTFVTLALNHFGYDFSYEGSQPASFDDSISAMAQKLFCLKDMPLLIDDFKRQTDPARERQQKALEEVVIRMVGDGLKRSRMTSEMTAQQDRPARGLCIQTGEELPQVTSSSVARLYVIELKAGEVPVPDGKASALQQERIIEMSELWQLAREGALNESMKGYIEWLIAQEDGLPERLEHELESLRQEAAKSLTSSHARLPSAIAYLMLGISMMLGYMSAPGGMLADTPEVAESLRRQCWEAILGNASDQAKSMRDEKPTAVFMTTLRELLQSGRNMVETLGRVSQVLPRDVIGYRDNDFYYLVPGEVFGAVQKSLLAQGDSLNIGKTTLMRQLIDEGIACADPGGKTTQQINRGGVHGRFLVLPRHIVDETPQVVKMEQGSFLKVDPDDNPFGGDDA